jgi:hypothetical protein
MYEQHLPPADDSPTVAASWARNIAQHERPALADKAAQTAHQLVAQAVRRTPPGWRIHAEITITDGGLLIEVRDPGQEHDPLAGVELAEVSTITKSLGTRRDSSGHLAWAELRAQGVAV